MPYGPGDAYRHTHKATSPVRDRQWRHVIDSARAEGKSEGAAIRMANGVIKKQVAHDKRAALLGSTHRALVLGGGETERVTIERNGQVVLTKRDGSMFDVDEDRDPEMLPKTAALPAAIGAIGRGLLSAARSPGVMRRAAIGAGVGALGGAATTGKDQSMVGRAIGGAALGSVGGALTSSNFRAGAMRSIMGKPAGRVFSTGSMVRPGAGTAMKAAPAVAAAQKVVPKLAARSLGALFSTPGVPTRVLGGAALGAGLAHVTRDDEDSGMGRVLAGGLLGAGAGAFSSKAFRGNLTRAVEGKPMHVDTRFSKTRPGVTPGAGQSPSAGFVAGTAARAVESVPRRVATRIRHTRSDFAAARAGMSQTGAARRRAAVDAVARRQRHATAAG